MRDDEQRFDAFSRPFGIESDDARRARPAPREDLVDAEVVPETMDEYWRRREVAAQREAMRHGPVSTIRRYRWPAILFVATCLSTFFVYGADYWNGFLYASAVMSILLCHEMGHFIQAVRHRVPASLPFFIPMPFSPIGTMGAVIRMDHRIPNRRALYDIGISGPLAGLVPTIAFVVLGLSWSEYFPAEMNRGAISFGTPPLFDWIAHWILGEPPRGFELYGHPFAMAGWVGMLVTALNLLPIGQLDGGHVLYAMLARRAHPVATGLLLSATFYVIYQGAYHWSIMLFLLYLMGAQHPPTQNDGPRLPIWGHVLGWTTLAFIPVGLTLTPIILPS